MPPKKKVVRRAKKTAVKKSVTLRNSNTVNVVVAQPANRRRRAPAKVKQVVPPPISNSVGASMISMGRELRDSQAQQNFFLKQSIDEMKNRTASSLTTVATETSAMTKPPPTPVKPKGFGVRIPTFGLSNKKTEPPATPVKPPKPVKEEPPQSAPAKSGYPLLDSPESKPTLQDVDNQIETFASPPPPHADPFTVGLEPAGERAIKEEEKKPRRSYTFGSLIRSAQKPVPPTQPQNPATSSEAQQGGMAQATAFTKGPHGIPHRTRSNLDDIVRTEWVKMVTEKHDEGLDQLKNFSRMWGYSVPKQQNLAGLHEKLLSDKNKAWKKYHDQRILEIGSEDDRGQKLVF